MAGVSYGMNTSGAYSVMGAIDGFAAEIRTDAFVSSVLKYSWDKLSQYFDLWMDAWAAAQPDSFMHVYKWPTSWSTGAKSPNYKQVMNGDPENRLWEHVYAGPAKDAVASFTFKEDDSYSPVNPILVEHDVKTGIHIFVHKAQVMEYGLPLSIDPKLARYLAFVHDPSKPKNEGKGFKSADGEVMFHPGTIKVREAGGGKTKGKFTTAFKYWYATYAPDHMAKDILPRVELDLYREMNKTGASTIGQVTKTKYVNMSAWASSNEQAYGKAKVEARRALKQIENNYIAQAAQRRADQYGE